MAKFDWQRYVFEDVHGQLREIRSCPITQLDRLKDYLDLLMQVLSELGNLDFKIAYCTNNQVKLLSGEVLRICGISPDWVSLEMAEKLIHHQLGDEDNFKPGILIEINFPQKEPTGGTLTDFKQWAAYEIASLLNIEGIKGIKEALEIADSIPFDLVDSVLLARYYQLNPKAKQAEELEELNSKPSEDDEKILNFAANQWQEIDLEKLL